LKKNCKIINWLGGKVTPKV